MKIRLCQHNDGAEQRLARLREQYPEADLKLKSCAKQCKTCKKQPFAIVDKHFFKADNEEKLWHVVVDAIKQSV